MDMAQTYVDLLDRIVAGSGASRNMLHVHAGMAIYLLVQFTIRDRRASPLALGIAVTVELLNEAVQRYYHGNWRWDDTSSDIALTLFWPIAITAMGNFRRRRWKRRQAGQAKVIRRSAMQRAPVGIAD